MDHPSQPRYAFLILAWLAGLTLWRLLAAQHAGVELYGDEAQYWTWSLHPDWGYYSKPPMVAWLIFLGTSLFGDSELGVRSPSLLLYALTSWVIFLFVRRLFRARPDADAMAFWSALLFATLPMTSLGSWLITTDAPLLLCWALSIYFTVAALETGRWRDWLLLGVAIGLGLLSKYSMVFYGLGFVVYVLASRERWSLLKDPKPYVAAALSFLFLVPNIVWNANHSFVSLHHTAEISELNRTLFHPGALLEFFVGQFLVFGPIAAAWLVVMTVRPRNWFSDDRLRLLAAFTLAPITAFLVLSLLSRAFANWVAFAYASGAALVAVALLIQGRRAWLIAALVVNLALGVVVYNFHDITRILDIQLTRKTDPYGRVTGFRAMGIEVGKRLEEHPGTHFLTDDRMLYALIRYYGRPYSRGGLYLNVSGRLDNHYALTADVRERPQGEFLLVSTTLTDDAVKQWFAKVTPQPIIRFQLYPGYAPEYRVWLVSGYKKP
jgi:4-amino-4-deoxy-L-arabinose transferase-like glycosyltransferase